MTSFSWSRAVIALRQLVKNDGEGGHLDLGQRASLEWMADRLPQNGVVLADEVGTGKTRIACAAIHAVIQARGRAGVVVPHGLIHQWQKEARVLGMPPPKSFTSMSDFIEDAKRRDWKEIAPAPTNPEWLLISHSFRTPQVRQGDKPAEWRVGLPSYVLTELKARGRKSDGRTLAGKLLDDPDETTHLIAEDLVKQVRGPERTKLRARLEKLPLFRRGGNNKELINRLRTDGRLIVEDLLGLWFGELNLLVIDEAHKSPCKLDAEETALSAVSGTVLTRLVDGILKQPDTGRRLCLTATPMELEPSQWLDLLRRARSGLDPERGREVINRLYDAARSASVAPDEVSRLEGLCKAARDFTNTLAPYVTRRRRDEDSIVTKFRTQNARSDLPLHPRPHPHRRLVRLSLDWTQTVSRHSPWIDLLFAAECMSQSARGLELKDTAGWPHSVRDAYTKLSAGHVSIDLSGTAEPFRVPEPGTIDDYTRGKVNRTAYWYRRLRGARKRVRDNLPRMPGSKPNPDAEHPRILAAVEEIELWTLQREKVLVFGVFLGPLRLLRDVLNVRHALREADAGRPIAHAIHTNPSLLGIALRQLGRLREKSGLSGCLSTGSGVAMRRALSDSHYSYQRLRRRLQKQAKNAVGVWRTDPTLLYGGPLHPKIEEALRKHLVSFALDNLLATTPALSDITREHFDMLASEFVEERLRPLLGELGDENVDEEQPGHRQKFLRKLLEDQDGHQSFHARLLEGATRWETRRYLQAAFNRQSTSPWVLIAQSQVGREGLNLHEACRVVVQFHAEWNPAVLEQQVGRVDRKGSLWEKRARDWLADGAHGEAPFVEIRQLIFEGTYDAFRWDRVTRRQHLFDASLFGSLLPEEAWDRVPEDFRNRLIDAAPSFRPGREG